MQIVFNRENKMTLYQILDENNLTANEFHQRKMALCYLDIIKELSPEHSYRIHKNETKSNSTYTAKNLIVNFG